MLAVQVRVENRIRAVNGDGGVDVDRGKKGVKGEEECVCAFCSAISFMDLKSLCSFFAKWHHIRPISFDYSHICRFGEGSLNDQTFLLLTENHKI